jgi:DNA-directed RNA polymerase specialized sigma24 family protein
MRRKSRELEDLGGQVKGVEAVDELTPRSSELDRRSASRLFDAHANDVFTYASRRVGVDVARDVVSEVFVIVIKNVGHYEPDLGSQLSWLYGIANNVLRHYWRAERRRLNLLAKEYRLSPGLCCVVGLDRGTDPEAESLSHLIAVRSTWNAAEIRCWGSASVPSS